MQIVVVKMDTAVRKIILIECVYFIAFNLLQMLEHIMHESDGMYVCCMHRCCCALHLRRPKTLPCVHTHDVES